VSYFGLTFGEYPGRWWGQAVVPPPPVVVFAGGDDAPRRRRAKPRDFEQERKEAAQLRRFLERLLEPVEVAAEVVTAPGVVAVVPKRGQDIVVPVPPAFSVAEVSEAVMSVLRQRSVESKRLRAADDRLREIVAAAKAETQRRLMLKRRREEEMLLLM
jgi:hypothetical protein